MPWGLLAFDGLLGAWFFAGVMEDFSRRSAVGQDATDSGSNIHLADGLLDETLAALLIAAGMCLLAQKRWAGVYQRAIFWALLVRLAFVGMELWLPSSGGVGGLGLIGMFFILAVLTSFAWAAALSLGDDDR